MRHMKDGLDSIRNGCMELFYLLSLFPFALWGDVDTSVTHQAPLSLREYLELLNPLTLLINEMQMEKTGVIERNPFSKEQRTEALQCLVTVLRQIALIVDKVYDVMELTGQERMVNLLEKAINDAKSNGQEEEQEEQNYGSDNEESSPLIQRAPHAIMPEQANNAIKALECFGTLRFVPFSLPNDNQLRSFFSALGFGNMEKVQCNDLERFLTLCQEMLRLYQQPVLEWTHNDLTFREVIQQMQSQSQELLLALQHHLERAFMVVKPRHGQWDFYVPDVEEQQDDADVFTPRPLLYHTLPEYVAALSAMMNKIVASLA